MLGAGEDQHLPPLMFFNQVREEFALAILIDGENPLRDIVGSGIARRDFDAGRVVQQAIGQTADFR
ncbi:MAG: hypothetical protein ACYDCV_14605 [Acidithiobacillus sp.]